MSPPPLWIQGKYYLWRSTCSYVKNHKLIQFMLKCYRSATFRLKWVGLTWQAALEKQYCERGGTNKPRLEPFQLLYKTKEVLPMYIYRPRQEIMDILVVRLDFNIYVPLSTGSCNLQPYSHTHLLELSNIYKCYVFMGSPLVKHYPHM